MERERQVIERRIKQAHFRGEEPGQFDFAAGPSRQKLVLELARCETCGQENVIA